MLPPDLDTKALIAKVNREDMWRAAAKAHRRRRPATCRTARRAARRRFFDGKVFDPANPKAYLAGLPIKKVA